MMKATRADWLALGEIHSDQGRVRAWMLLRNLNSRHFYLELLTNTYISGRSLWDLVCKLLNICSSSASGRDEMCSIPSPPPPPVVDPGGNNGSELIILFLLFLSFFLFR